MFGKKNPPPIKSLIAEGTTVQGDLQFSEGLRLDGQVRGRLSASQERPSILVVSEQAVVDGAVSADHIIVNGRITGPVHARQMLELQPKARINGDVTYRNLEMHMGAVVHGTLIPNLETLEEPPQIPPQASLTNDSVENS